MSWNGQLDWDDELRPLVEPQAIPPETVQAMSGAFYGLTTADWEQAQNGQQGQDPTRDAASTKLYRCMECSLLRVRTERGTCEECQSNAGVAYETGKTAETTAQEFGNIVMTGEPGRYKVGILPGEHAFFHCPCDEPQCKGKQSYLDWLASPDRL